MKFLKAILIFVSFTSIQSCVRANQNTNQTMTEVKGTVDSVDQIIRSNPSKYDTATFGAGCFWCVEAQFQMLDGVVKVESGFSGGHVKNPSYKEVCNGTTGHAEVTNITYDTSKISYKDMLEAFWKAHDPTQLNGQGADIGTQYRSVIFYHNEEQRKLAEEYKKRLNDEKAYDKPVVTEISPFTVFYKAEDYHQNYFNENGEQPYCKFVVAPKVEKFKKVFGEKLKKEYSH